MRLAIFGFAVLICAVALPGKSYVTSEDLRVPSRAPFALQLPDLGENSITAVESHIQTTELRTMKFTVRQPFADAINYGKIYTAINGEAANTVCGNVRSGRDGKIIVCDLERKPRFRLQPGKNVVEISAVDQDNNSYYASYVLIAGKGTTVGRGPSDQSQPLSFSGRKFAVVIGVSEYQFPDAGLANLKFADEDARSIRQFLLDPRGGGFRQSDILYMVDREATTEVVRDALVRFLPKAGPNDLVFIYIASHGSPDPFDPKRLYFLLNDTKVANLPKTALDMSELQQLLDHTVRAERVIVLIDSCHSAGVAGTKLITGRQLARAENNIFNLYASKLYRETGRAVLTSSDVTEVSEEGAHWGGGHGVFTWSVLEGLRGDADVNGDKVITTGELFDFVNDKVSHETQGRQNPRALPGTNRNFPLARVKG